MSSLSATFLGFTLAALGLYVFSRNFRGRVRIELGSISILSSLLGLTATTVFLAADFNWAKSDLLSLIGLLITILLTIFASEYMRSLRTMRVGIVIPSTRPFHQELRQGLIETLNPQRYSIMDPYDEGVNPDEDLSKFMPILHQAVARRSDVLLICSPSVALANSPALISECERFTRRGGHVFFVESVPSPEILSILRFATALVSDSRQSAALLSHFLRDRWNALPEADKESARILVIPGPQHSRPAADRLQALQAELAEVPIDVAYSFSWTCDETEALAKLALRNTQNIRFICCGNDDMARGAVVACFELGISKVEIFGHDGLYETIVSIADPFSPLTATIQIPPKAFGYHVGSLLEALPTHWGLLAPGGFWLYRHVQPETVVLPITRASLVTRYNAPLQLKR